MAEKDCCLIVFAKEPVPGQVKTRLSSALGQDRAVTLYKAFLKDTYALAQFIPVHLRVLAYESFGSIPQYLYSTFPHFVFYPQHGDDFGMRIQDAVIYAKHMGAGRIVIIGADSPTLPSELIAESFERLKKHDIVLGPRQDGGFYLLGLKNFHQDIFKNISWGEEKIFDCLRANIEEAGFSYYVLCDWYDIDRPDDLKKLVNGRLSSRAGSTEAVIRAMGSDRCCD